MPVMDGLKLLEQAKRIRPQLPVLVITGYGDIPMAVKAIKIGAAEFIEKPLNESTFLPAVEAALKKGLFENRLIAKPLTKAETQILRQIAEGKTNKEIAFKMCRSIRTIENHRYRLMRKLNAQSTADLTKKAINMGLTSAK